VKTGREGKGWQVGNKLEHSGEVGGGWKGEDLAIQQFPAMLILMLLA
jgi:hypothetical protein